MKPTTVSDFDASETTVIFACDVSKDTINLFTKIGQQYIDHAFENRTNPIENELNKHKEIANKSGFKKILLVAEATGTYHETLFRTARRIGLETAWVSPEAVAKMRVIETNDSGKTDIKDPRVIHTLASIGKTLTHRVLEDLYALLSEWDKVYDVADRGVVRARCEIHHQLRKLFPDYGFKKDFLYSPSGIALMEHYGCNPYRIVQVGLKHFTSTIKKAAPRIRLSSIDRLFQQAKSSVKADLAIRHVQLLELRLHQTWEDYLLHNTRKQEAKQAMEDLYKELRKTDPNLPQGRKGVVTTFHLARIIAETGPLSDFNNWRKLLRFAGLNLRERQSGKYRGKTKISKKGRTLLRKVLSQVALPLVKSDRLYGPYYHHKKIKEKMPGTKAMTAVSRHFLKMLYGWYRSRSEFNHKRIFICESQYQKAA